MQYEHRVLSEEKAEQLNARQFVNMYGSTKRFDGGWKCVVTGDESVIFTQIGYSHEDDIPDQYFLEYHGWYFYMYEFEEMQGSEPNGIGADYKILSKITRIVNATFDGRKEAPPAMREVIAVVKEVMPVWKQYNSGRLSTGDRVITKVHYEGESYE